MTKGKGPWDGDEPATETGGEHAEAETGARSPWQSGDDPQPGRRSAHIDDIFQSRAGRRIALPTDRFRPGALPWAIVAVLSGVVLASSIHVVGDGERGVVTRLGRYDRTLGAGLNATLPWPIEQVQSIQVSQIRDFSIPEKPGENLMLTRDGELIDVAYQVRWRITDLAAYAFRVKQPEQALQQLADAELRASVAEVSFDPLWDGSRTSEVAERARKRIQTVLDAWHAGIRVEGVEISHANAPGKLTDAFVKIRKARDTAREAGNNADKWAAEKLATARAEASQFDEIYAQYKVAPRTTQALMYYQTMERVIGNAREVVVGAASSNVSLPGGPAPTPAQPPAPAAQEGQ